jgi:hypothetical protein
MPHICVEIFQTFLLTLMVAGRMVSLLPLKPVAALSCMDCLQSKNLLGFTEPAAKEIS